MKLTDIFFGLCVICCVVFGESKQEDLKDHFIVSDRNNNKFIIVGPDYDMEADLDFDFEKKFIKSLKANFHDGVLKFYWTYFNNKGEVYGGKMSSEDLKLKTEVMTISKTSSISDIDVVGGSLYASTVTGEIYVKELQKEDESESLVDDEDSIIALKVDDHHRNIYFVHCADKSVLVSKSISLRKEYETPICFQILEIDGDTLYAAAANKIYAWDTRKAGKTFNELLSTDNGDIRNLIDGDGFLYYKTKKNRYFKMDKKTQKEEEILELSSISATGSLAYFKAPTFIPPKPTTTAPTTTLPTTTKEEAIPKTSEIIKTTKTTIPSTTQTAKPTTAAPPVNWFVKYQWYLVGLVIIIIIILIILLIFCLCRKRNKNYQEM